MNEQPPQPQPQQNQPGQPGIQPSLYQPAQVQPGYSGYDLAHNNPVQPPAGQPQPMIVQAQPQVQIPHPQIQAPPQQVDSGLLNWQASEYVHHIKSPLWYVVYVLAMLALLAVAFFLTHSWTFIVLVIVMAISVGVYANRPPRTIHYILNEVGIQIDDKAYSYSDFRAFGILADEALYSLILIPTKRFMPAISVFFEEANGEKIVDILGSYMPMEQLHLDIIDRIVRRLRF